MTSFLREAFGLACAPFQKLNELYDLAGYYAWQALMNDQFLAVSPAAFTSKPMQTAAQAYDWALPRARAAAVQNITLRNAGSDYGPKPDIKPALMKIGEFCLAQAGRLHWGHPVVTCALVVAFGAVAYGMMHAGLHSNGGHGAAMDALGTAYSSAPQQPRPSND